MISHLVIKIKPNALSPIPNDNTCEIKSGKVIISLKYMAYIAISVHCGTGKCQDKTHLTKQSVSKNSVPWRSNHRKFYYRDILYQDVTHANDNHLVKIVIFKGNGKEKSKY